MSDDLTYYGKINIETKSNVFLFNEDEASLYDELYFFKKWPNIEIDFVSLRLSEDDKFYFHKACTWMQKWTCYNKKPQYIWVRNGKRIYTVYFNIFESIQYFRKFVLGEDIRRLVLYYGYIINVKNDSKIEKENNKRFKIYDKMFDFFKDKLTDNFCYTKSPHISSSDYDLKSGHKDIIIVEALPGCEYKIKEFQKECGEYSEYETESYHACLETLIDYDVLGPIYLEKRRN